MCAIIEVRPERSQSTEEPEVTTTLQSVYERQRAAELARERAADIADSAYWDLSPRDRERVDLANIPSVKAAQAEADALTTEVSALRAEVGGSVFRVVDSKLAELGNRIEKLNKKAVKLGTEPISLTVSDEHAQVTVKEDGREWVTDYTFVIVNGETPMIAGWVFVASLDHEADQGADESVGIRRAPVGVFLRSRIGEEAAAAVEGADLTRYRHASNDCDHCGFNRRRKQTYVLYEIATGELRQIGSTCLTDYTGAGNNPERIAAWAEWLEGLYRDLERGGDEGGGGGGRIAIRTLDFLANVSAVIGERGWQSRWRKDAYGDSERNHGATADVAMGNIFERKEKYRIPVTDADYAEAQAALDYVRDELAEQDEHSEFEHNLVTYCRADYLGEKGDGFVAYAIMARRRATEKQIVQERKAEQAATSEWIGSVGDRIKGLTFTVTFTREFEGHYGISVLTKGLTANGEAVLWFGKGGAEQGKTYEVSATVKAHETDDYNGGGKVTKITNVRGLKEVENGAASEVEVTKTAAQREADRLSRIKPGELDERIDSARATYNEYSNAIAQESGPSFDGSMKRYYEQQLKQVGLLIERLEADQRAIKEINACSN
jgi:hypothetical protein